MQFVIQQLNLTLVVFIVGWEDRVRRIAALTLWRWPFRTELLRLGPKRGRTDSRDGEDACERAGGGCGGVLHCHSPQEDVVVVSRGWRERVVFVLVVWGVRVSAGHFGYVYMEKIRSRCGCG